MGELLDGTIRSDFWPVARTLERQLRTTGGGAAVCIYHRGEPVVDVWGGKRDYTRRRWTSDTMAMSFSTTKGVTSTLLHILVDRGLLDYEDRVADHWPEFGANGKSGITVRHLLVHQAGLPHLRSLIDDGWRMLDWGHMVTALERARPLHAPGQHTAYHAFTFGWLVGALIERVTGRGFAQLVQDEIAKPLGLDGLYVGAPREVWERAADLSNPSTLFPAVDRYPCVTSTIGSIGKRLGVYTTEALLPPKGSEVFWSDDVLGVPIPAVNGLFTARSLARMYAALGNGGTLDGKRILSRRTLVKATEVQCKRIDRTLLFPPQWRLGYHGVLAGLGLVRGAFGHFGFGGSGGFASPEHELAVAMVNNRVGGGPMGDGRIVQLASTALRCARNREAVAS